MLATLLAGAILFQAAVPAAGPEKAGQRLAAGKLRRADLAGLR